MSNQNNQVDTIANASLAVQVGSSNATLPWHIHNTGQNGAKPGLDLDILPVWQKYDGSGVHVGIFDDGSTVSQSQLTKAFDTAATTSFGTVGEHSTAVAGIIAAGLADSPAVGIAPDVSAGMVQVIGLNLSQIGSAMSQLVNYDVANNSWGWTANYYVDQTSAQWKPFFADIQNAADHGRNGLGTVMAVAGGNNGVAGGSTELSNFTNDRHVITVAAVTDQGKVADYSNRGASILVAGLSNGGQNGITTTDLSGSDGYSPGSTTSTFGGTSAATPEISGITALMLEANPNLGWRDVKEILAMTARPVDGSTEIYNSGHNWNGGGLGFSNDVGFGLVDAAAAVRLANSWTLQSTSVNESALTASSSTAHLLSPGSEVDYQLKFNTGVSLETVQVAVSGSVAQSSGLEIDLVSPTGVVSTLMSGQAGSQAFQGWTYTSNAFLGQDSGGLWTVRVIDSASGSSGQITGVTLNAYGSQGASHTYYYTDQFGTLSQIWGHGALSDSSGPVTLNTAATSGDATIDLNQGATSTIAGGSLTIAKGTVVTSAYLGAGNDTIRANDAGDAIYGGDGNDTITGGSGSDHIVLGSGSNTVDGGKGVDVAIIHGSETQFSITSQAGILTVTNTGSGAVDHFSNTEMVQFDDGAAFNVASSSEAGLVAMYEAGLDRAPDQSGFTFWLQQLRSGQKDLGSIAANLLNSNEFTAVHGSLQGVQLVNLLYNNLDHRAPTTSELADWSSQIATNHLSSAQILATFAGSQTVQPGLIGIVHVVDGIA